MDEEFPQPPEAALIERLRKGLGKKNGAVSRVAKASGISEGRWRQLAKGYQQANPSTRLRAIAPADTLARMAQTVGATPDELRVANRPDAADALERMTRTPASTPTLRAERMAELREGEPDVPLETPKYAEVAELSWRALTDLAISALGDPQHRLKAAEALAFAGDFYVESLLALNIGPAGRPLLQDIFTQSIAARTILESQEADGSSDDGEGGSAAAIDAAFSAAIAELKVHRISDDSKKSGRP